MIALAAVPAAHAVTITVRTPDGQLITTGFRYTIQEDRTYDVIPGCTGITPLPAGCPATTSAETLSLGFHRSYMPVVATGESAGATADVALADTTKRYFVSVLPMADTISKAPLFAMGGAPLRPDANGVLQPLTVTVDAIGGGLKPAQISVFLFNDDNPINNTPDAPPNQERGLCGFEMHLYDAGGTYGASGGRIYADAFGNPLGTEYNADGSVAKLGSAILKTDANGVLRIKNLAPAKYTIFALAPMFQPTAEECPLVVNNNNNIGLYGANAAAGQIAWGKWKQTATIEGTWGVDAWVKSGEPTFFKEFGPPGHHVFIGFVKEFNALTAAGGSSVSGQVVNVHMSRPPSVAFHHGEVVDKCWVGLNEVAAGVGAGRGVYAGPCNADGSFSISGLQNGRRYQLAIWDDPLDQVFAAYDFVTPAGGGAVALNQVPVFRWFGKWEGKICHDRNNDGFCAADEPGIPGQAVNLRFRDGSIYQSSGTDESGNYELTEIFPFFNWMVAEVDFARFKATGATVVVDAGGQIPPDQGWTMPSDNKRTPQLQPDNANAPFRTEAAAPVLLQGMQTFLGTNNRIDWGKQPYAGNDNGGISGIVYYASTRAEGDPRFTAGENNEPGIPGVTVRLYRADPSDRRKIMNVNGDTVIDANDAVAVVTTDSWDASVPENCAGSNQMNGVVPDTACFDGLRNYNQVRPAVFDGGYAFVEYMPGGINSGGTPQPLAPGNYIVEVVPPVGYEIQKEEDKNVDFGDSYAVAMQALPPECVGDRPYPVPAELTLFPGVPVAPEYRDNPPVETGTYANYTGKRRPHCDRLAVTVVPQANPPANFYLFTKTPVAGHIVGMILDDLANEFSPYSPNFGEKYAPPFMPISLRDQAGREFSRVYSDRFGTYNALVPSTFTYNVPIPSGVSPNMVQACLNSPYMPDPDNAGQFKLDPHFNKSYTQFCYTFQYLPGKTTYLDTPVLPTAAFAGPSQFPLDCEAPTATPAIASVTNAAGTGPYLSAGNQTLTIRSMGTQQVLNPLYNLDNPASGVPKLIDRDYGFGATQGTGSVTISALVPGGATVNVSPTVNNWSNDQITVTISATQFSALTANAQRGGTLLVTRSGGNTTQRGVFVHAGGPAPMVVGKNQTYKTIQAAIDAAVEPTTTTGVAPLITVEPGLYEESVILNKRLRVQGFGAGSTLINAVKMPTEKQQQWREKVCDILFELGQNGLDYLVPGQEMPANKAACLTGDTVDNAPLLFGNEEGAGFFVLVKDQTSNTVLINRRLRIDGFTITGADQGGGIMVNGHARRLQISNNRITGNQGIEAGGIRVGHSTLIAEVLLNNGTNALQYTDAVNRDVTIHHNEIVQNGDTAGTTGGGGGGIALFTGSHGYRVANNFVCGNYSTGDGGGIAHIGRSTATTGANNNGVPTIERNRIVFNQSFNQGTNPNGGGIAITGLQAPNLTTGISAGTGSVLINANTIQGNLAGAGDGGGISLYGVNGVELPPSNDPVANENNAHRIDIVNNVIVNNVAGVAGGGIALQDAISVRIVNNTITHNDSVATGSRALASPSLGIAQPGAGIVARTHGGALAGRIGGTSRTLWSLNQQYHSNPVINGSIVFENRMFHWVVTEPQNNTGNCIAGGTNTCYGLVSDGFSDLAVIGGAYQLTANYSDLTSLAGVQGATNSIADPLYVARYFNGPRDAIIQQNEVAVPILSVAAALDEGGNFIDTRFGPLTQNCPYPLSAPLLPYGNYRITASGLFDFVTVPYPTGGATGIAALANDAAGTPRGAAPWTVGAFEGVTGLLPQAACTAPAP
jgi:hypothetical protein